MNRRNGGNAQDGGEGPILEARAASRLLDEALTTFGLLQAAASLEDGPGDDDTGALLATLAQDLLDDVAALAALVGSCPSWPAWPPVPVAREQDPVTPPALAAVEALADYTQRLAAGALVFGNRGSTGSKEFARLAAAAESRMAFLWS